MNARRAGDEPQRPACYRPRTGASPLSAGLAAFAAYVVFWVVLLWGWLTEELGRGVVVTFLVLWVAGWIASAYLPYGPDLFPSFVAVLDIVLVFLAFKGDVHLT